MRTSLFALSLLWLLAGAINAQQYGNRLGVQRGGRTTFEPQGAGVLFDAIDVNFPATFSQKIIKQMIRKHIGFNGLLLTDDLSMGALVEFTLTERVELALKAGCDLILHCNANMSEMSRIAPIIPELSKSLIEKSNINFNKIENNHYDNNALKEEFNILCKNTFVK